jgi:hypothetical protein
MDEVFDSDWNDAVDAFDPPESEDEHEDAFQDALREMVRNLQRVAFERGVVNGGSGGVRLDIQLGVGQSKALVKAMLNDDPVTLSILPFE